MTRAFKGKYYSAKRRAIYAQGDDIDHLELFNLHGWICCICHEKIDSKLRFPHQMAATVEHIVPLCLGGTHTWENVKPAHAICNFTKGATLHEEYIEGNLIHGVDNCNNDDAPRAE